MWKHWIFHFLETSLKFKGTATDNIPGNIFLKSEFYNLNKVNTTHKKNIGKAALMYSNSVRSR